jgi:hypothetical protein
MKNFLLLFCLSCFVLVSCKDDDNDVINLKKVTIQLAYPQNSGVSPTSDVVVKMISSTSSYEAKSDVSGKAVFTVPTGVYEVTATESRTVNFNAYLYNGLQSGLVVADNWVDANTVTLQLNESKSAQVIIKELFVGGTPKDDGSGSFAFDKYIILYNNSLLDADLKDVCIGIAAPYNAQASNNFYGEDGKLLYEAENWIPATNGFWYFTQSTILKPGKQIVVALNNAVNNTLTYSKSINFDNSEYYCTYDIENYPNVATYASPVASIPTNHFLKAERYGTATAWPISNSSPATFIFKVEGTTPAAFAANASLTHTLNAATTSKKVPVDWILDGVETHLLNNANNKKRLTSKVDAGYVYHENTQGFAVYRNVDKTATEALAENAGKLVYNYSLGTINLGAGGSTDGSGIDAEASIKNGAKIIYLDSNNSSNDFHLRSKASLRNN